MILRRLLADGQDPTAAPPSVDVADSASRDTLRRWYAQPAARWLRLNLIASVDGSARGVDGTSETLSNSADRAILGVIRSLADVVLIGAETLRAEGYLLPRRSQLAVLTRTGELAGAGPQPGRQHPPVLVLGPASAESRARATLDGVDVEFIALAEGGGGVDPGAAIDALRDQGAESIVCEGGPRVAAAMLDAGLVDEICLATSPKLTGTAAPALGAPSPRELRLEQLLADETGGLYARWIIGPGEGAGRRATR